MADIIQLASGRQFKNIRELQEFCEMQFIALTMSNETIKHLEEKVKHLEELLDATVKTEIIIKSPEQGLVENQIERYCVIGNQRQLTAEEVKSLDVLIKNKLLLSGEATTINGDTKQKKKLTPAELTLIAKKDK